MAAFSSPPDLDSSKHNPDFGGRNLQRKHELQTLLSNLQLRLEEVYWASDQQAFDDLYQRIKQAGDGLQMCKPEPKKSTSQLAHEKHVEDLEHTWASRQ